MNNIKRGDVFWVNFGTNVGSEQSGVRPAIVIQNNIGNKFSPTLVVASITSKFSKRELPTHVEILDYRRVGLTERSQILTEQVRTIDKSRLNGYIGRIDSITMAKMNKAIEISVDVGNVVEDRVINSIKVKVERIKVLDSLLVEMFLSEGDRDFEAMKEIVSEREGRLKDLEMFASKNNIDYKLYYNPMQQNKLDRMVG